MPVAAVTISLIVLASMGRPRVVEQAMHATLEHDHIHNTNNKELFVLANDPADGLWTKA